MNYIVKILLLLIGMDAFGFGAKCWGAEAQRDTLGLQLHFRQGDDLLLKDYRDNTPAIEKLIDLLCADSTKNISVVNITGSASPEGDVKHNQTLAMRRAKAVQSYIRWKVPQFDPNLILISADPDFSSAWLETVEQDASVPRRGPVIEILQSSASIATKWANIQLLAGGSAEYMEQYIFPSLRNAVSCVVVLKDPSLQQATTAQNQPITTSTRSTAITVTATPEATPSIPDEFDLSAAPEEMIRKPLFALKTNLLFDAASLLNIELEVPIGKRFSIAGELIAPWWLWESKQHCLQLFSGNLEGRYWFGNREQTRKGTPRQTMTGWFAGIYAGGGYYDLEWDKTGYQGEFFIAAGISGGYAHTINRCGNLRMEYSLGVGYLQTDYRKYESKMGADNKWHLYRRETGNYKWFGPTRLKVSLVWMLNYKKKGGVQ